MMMLHYKLTITSDESEHNVRPELHLKAELKAFGQQLQARLRPARPAEGLSCPYFTGTLNGCPLSIIENAKTLNGAVVLTFFM
jgi:hypothetical protein